MRSEIVTDHHLSGWRLEKLTLASHTASHVDAPLHKLAGGASLDDIPLERWVGLAHIADLRDSVADLRIGAALMKERLPAKEELADRIVLLATGWGQKRAKTAEWESHAPQLDADGAAYLVEARCRGVGIDHYSVGDARTHEVLLSAGVWIVEELRFTAEAMALPQPVKFWSLPINLKGHSGAFCRPVIVVEE